MTPSAYPLDEDEMRPFSRAFFFSAGHTVLFQLRESVLHCVLVLAPPVVAGSSPEQPEFSRHGLRDSERQTPRRIK